MLINMNEVTARMRLGAFSVYGLNNLDEWICKNTRINQKPFSFKDREFQIPILRDSARDQIVVKCAQVGLSELSYRWAVAACCVMQNFTVIYTFPTTGDAVKNNQQRIDPMIEGSPELSRLVSPHLNNSEMKKFGENSFLFFKGTVSDTNALSTPADALIHDEFDKSDQDNVATYVSRLQDKETKIRKIFSTPTVANYGVDAEARNANRMMHLATCVHCNHTFLPDYYQHVKIPGYNNPLEEITKLNLHTVRWREAELKCPKCGKNPDLHHTRMPWVCENPNLDYHANAWFVSPFSAHKRILVPNLVKDSTSYKTVAEFKNQALGLTAEDKNEAITVDDIAKMQCEVIAPSSEVHQMGIDIGLICNVAVGRELFSGQILVQHRERVAYTRLEERVAQLRKEYRVTTCVVDSQPMTDLTNRLCQANPNTWGSQYITTKSPVPFRPAEEEEDKEEGKLGFRYLKVNRNVVLDEVLEAVKRGLFIVNKSDENAVFEKQMLSMKRVKKFTNSGELVYVWVKTGDEEDHYHHSLTYLKIATQMRHTAGTPGMAAVGLSPLQVLRKKTRKVTNGATW